MNAISQWTLAPLSGTAYAQQCLTLVYTGAPLTVTSTGNGPPTLPSAITGVIMLSTGLPANGTTTATLSAFDFSTVYQNIVTMNIYPNGYDGVPPTFTFTTVNGVITSWNAALTYTYGYYDKSTDNTYTLDFTLSPQGDSITAFMNVVGNGTSGTTTGTNSTAGAWRCATSIAAELATANAATASAQAQVTTLQSQLAATQAKAAANAEIAALKAEIKALEK